MSHSAGANEIGCRVLIYAIAFTEDGKNVLGGGNDGSIRRWRIQDAQAVATTNTGANLNGVVTSRDGRWVVGALGHPINRAVVWNATTYEKVVEVTEHAEHGAGVDAIDISNDSMRFVTGSYDQTVCIFSIISGVRLVGPLRHDNQVVGVKFSPSGDFVATATRDRDSVRVYNAHTGQKLFDVPVKVKAFRITPLAWSSDGQELFAVSPGKMTSFNVPTSSRTEWPIHNTCNHASIVANGRFIACSAGSSVSFWDALSHKQISPVVEHTSAIVWITLSPDEKYLACGRKDKIITIHDLSNVIPSLYFTIDPPLMRLSEAAFKSWTQEDATKTEEILSQAIEGLSEPAHYALANRALLRTRLNRWSEAIEDAKKSLQVHQSPIGHIANALALAGQGDQEAELSAFDLAFRDCNLNENRFLLLLKSIFLFTRGKHAVAMSRITDLIPAEDDNTTYYYTQVLGNMCLKKGEYEQALQLFERNKHLAPTDEKRSPLITISLIFGWSFDRLEIMACRCLCERLYASGRTKEVVETVWRVVTTFNEDDKETAYGRFLEDVITRSGNVALLTWNGKSSPYHSCLPSPSIPHFYNQETRLTSTPSLETETSNIEARTERLRTTLSQLDAMVIYDRITRLPPVRFMDRHLHLPCIVFRIRGLSVSNSESQGKETVYRAKVTGLGKIEITTSDSLPVQEPERLVLVHPRIQDIRGPHDDSEEELEVDEYSDEAGSDAGTDVFAESELILASLVDLPPSAPSDAYSRALELIARLGEPFTALLLLQQPGGVYKRVATEHEIVVQGMLSTSKVVRTEVLEIL